MIKGLYSAATALVALDRAHDVSANNIANASTSGFRAQKTVKKGFYDVFMDQKVLPSIFNRNSAPGGGTKLVETYTDTQAGHVVTTDNPAHVALQGPGYFMVDTPNGSRYTRNGEFTIDAEGDLATMSGFKVQGSGGPINASQGPLTISADGIVSSGGATVGQLQLTEFEDPHMLSHDGDGLYRASDAALARSSSATSTGVTQNALEMSNVNMPQEMVNMILGLRAYGANQNVISAMNETMTKVIEEVGTPV